MVKIISTKKGTLLVSGEGEINRFIKVEVGENFISQADWDFLKFKCDFLSEEGGD